jgi:uncharacterized protein YggE
MGRVLSSALALLPAALLLPPTGGAAAESLPRCDGTLLEARGSAKQQRPTRSLGVSLSLAAQAPDADAALAELQRRLADVRAGLLRLQVTDLEVGSPSTWEKPARDARPAGFEARLSLQGRLAPERLQPLIREVGALPGVRLAPVRPQADPAADPAVRRQLLRQAYQDALRQAGEIGAVIGRPRLSPLEVQLEGGLRPVPMRAMADAAPAPPPFDPAELPRPVESLSMLVRFCAR